MTVGDLAYKCKDIEIDCDKCQYKKECASIFEEMLDGASPYMLLTILEKQIEV
ncbi:MAG: hypothetical protein NC126_09170 [Clostridium sp.]|nr:hypothetical protein [Clostridium sp.]